MFDPTLPAVSISLPSNAVPMVRRVTIQPMTDFALKSKLFQLSFILPKKINLMPNNTANLRRKKTEAKKNIQNKLKYVYVVAQLYPWFNFDFLCSFLC